MLPDQPYLVKCPHCSTLVWIGEQTEVGEIDHRQTRAQSADAFPDARPAPTPTFAEYAAFLAATTGGGSSASGRRETSTDEDREEQLAKERYVRLRAWWAGNDPRRRSEHPTPLDPIERENLRALIAILDESDDSARISKAEALRELGEFAEAERLLATKFDPRLMQAVGIIRALAQSRRTTVVEMKF